MRFLLVALQVFVHAEAFSCTGRVFQSQQLASSRIPTSSRLSSDTADSLATETLSPYDRIGIKEEELAIGVDPEEVIEYIGTRDDLVEKALVDIPSFDKKTAESEVSKFLLDQEALLVFIEYRKRKAEDPDFEVPPEEQESIFNFRNFAIVYLGYLAYVTVPGAFKDWVKSKEEAGEWNGSGIPFIDNWLSESQAVDALASAQDSVVTPDQVEILGNAASEVANSLS